MGDPGKTRKKYTTPRHPWMRERIDTEKAIKQEYGIRRNDEIWKMNSKLKNFHDVAKKTVALGDKGDLLRTQLFTKLQRLGILGANQATIDDVLSLTLKNIMDRRLQTIVCKKKLAHTPLQARQFIVHGHIIVGGKKVTSPAYLVPLQDEANLSFAASSALASEDHPERVREEGEPVIVETATTSSAAESATETATENASAVTAHKAHHEKKTAEVATP